MGSILMLAAMSMPMMPNDLYMATECAACLNLLVDFGEDLVEIG